MTNTTTAGVSGATSAALVVILCTLFPVYDQNFWGSVVMVAFAVPSFGVAAVLYILKLRRLAHETDEVATAHADALAEAAEARRRAEARQIKTAKETS
jgi:hypothetical protein